MADLMAQLAPYLGHDGVLTKALGAPGGAFSSPDVWQDPRLHAAEVPAANGICDARSLAHALRSLRERCRPVRWRHLPGTDPRSTGQRTRAADRRSRLRAPGHGHPVGTRLHVNVGTIALAGLGGPRSFGHFGMGGSVGWADPDLGLGVGYVMNRMSLGATGDSRSADLIHATLAAIAAAPDQSRASATSERRAVGTAR